MLMPRIRRAIALAACAGATATAAGVVTTTPAAAAGSATAYYSCYPNYPITGALATSWLFSRSAGGQLYVRAPLVASIFLGPTIATGSLAWGSGPATVTGMDVRNGVSAPVELRKSGTAALASAPDRVEITFIPYGTVTSCYLSPGSGTGFPI
jgi:hypothetical protein